MLYIWVQGLDHYSCQDDVSHLFCTFDGTFYKSAFCCGPGDIKLVNITHFSGLVLWNRHPFSKFAGSLDGTYTKKVEHTDYMAKTLSRICT